MPITLESRIRRMQVVNLPHEAFCRERCECTEMTVVIAAENPRTGERAPTRVSKRVPTSMTWLAGERRTGLTSVLLEVPDVKAAIACGFLRLVEQTSAPVSGAVDATSPPTPGMGSAPTPATRTAAAPTPATTPATASPATKDS